MPREKTDRLLVGVEEAARLLDVAPITIRRMVRKGELTAIRAGKLVKFSRVKLEAWIEARYAESERARKKGRR